MTELAYEVVDVFTDTAFAGNPLAVVLGGDDLTTEQCQALANEFHLSETSVPMAADVEGADYRLRIFTPGGELPFAGHPTLGSAAAWLGAGGEPQQPGRVVQQCGVGLVPVRVDGDRLAFAAPPLRRYEPVEDELRDRVTRALGLGREDVHDASWLVNGPEWLGIRVRDAAQVLALRLDPAPVAGLDIGVVGPYPPGGDVQFEVRGFLARDAVLEDPVTGSLNAGLGHWLIATGQAPRSYVAAQGRVVGAAGRVHVDQDDDALWVGGRVATVVRGTVDL
jgi:PhzF family phenazine biosynthesis protein